MVEAALERVPAADVMRRASMSDARRRQLVLRQQTLEEWGIRMEDWMTDCEVPK